MFDVEESVSAFCSDEEEYRFNCELTPEENLWAAVTHRALRDAQGYRLGTDSDSGNNHIQRAARKWFRARDRLEGWGWIVESLGIPAWMERRILREAHLNKGRSKAR